MSQKSNEDIAREYCDEAEGMFEGLLKALNAKDEHWRKIQCEGCMTFEAKDTIIAEKEARIKKLEEAIRSKCSSMLMIEGCDGEWCKDCVIEQALKGAE